MSRTTRLRNAIVDYLEARPNASTTLICEHINSRYRWGATMNQVGNVLAKDRRFEKVGFDDGIDIWGFRTRVCIWAIASS